MFFSENLEQVIQVLLNCFGFGFLFFCFCFVLSCLGIFTTGAMLLHTLKPSCVLGGHGDILLARKKLQYIIKFCLVLYPPFKWNDQCRCPFIHTPMSRRTIFYHLLKTIECNLIDQNRKYRVGKIWVVHPPLEHMTNMTLYTVFLIQRKTKFL